MKRYEMVLNFRRAFFKFDYVKDNTKKLSDLRQWVDEWCKENGLGGDRHNLFFELALIYAEKEYQENLVILHIKRLERKKNKEF